MKTRNGLVSNSSTSSFTCCICGGVEAYSDGVGMSDMGGTMCSRGHMLHETCSDKYKVKPERTEVSDDDSDEGYTLHTDDCPVCQLKVIPYGYAYKFLRLKYGITPEDILNEVKNIYGDYNSFASDVISPSGKGLKIHKSLSEMTMDEVISKYRNILESVYGGVDMTDTDAKMERLNNAMVGNVQVHCYGGYETKEEKLKVMEYCLICERI